MTLSTCSSGESPKDQILFSINDISFEKVNIGINYVIKKDSSSFLKNISGPITGLALKSGGYVKKPINVMQIENLGKLTNIEKCNNLRIN